MKVQWYFLSLLLSIVFSCNSPSHQNNPEVDSTDIVDTFNLQDIDTDEPVMAPADTILADSIVMTHPELPAEEPSKKTACIDKSKIKKDAMCTMDYNPVCGCNGKTYSNACVAENAGVTKWEKGECK